MNEQDNNTVVVTGATGRQGGAVARELLKTGYKVRAITRNPDSQPAKELAKLGAQVVKCDLNDIPTVKQTLRGAWGAFAVFQSLEPGVKWETDMGKRFAETAKNAGIKHYVYSSVASASRKTGIPHFESKAVIEAAVRKTGFEFYTILRPAFFMENFTGPMMLPELEKGRLSIALGPATKLQMIAVEDIGKFGLAAFRRSIEFNRAEMEMAGDEKTMPEAADILTAAFGRKVQYIQADIMALRIQSPEMATMMQWLDKVGLNINLAAIPAKYGVQPMTFSQWAQKVKLPAHAR